MNIIPVIRDLLLRNQKAVIPGLGAFVMAQRPAQLNKVTRVLTPPGITVRFDRHQQSDDGQLTGYLTRKLKLDKDAALQAIDEFKTSIAEKLGNDEPIVLEGLGTLTKKKTGETTFIPEEELVKRISLFEMPKVEVPQNTAEKVVQPPVTAPVTITEKKVPITREISRPGSRRWIIPVILLGLLVGMLGFIYFTGNMDMLVSDIKTVFGIARKDTTEQLVFGKDTGEQVPSDTLTSQISRELDAQVDRGKALAYD
ncbi:MAG TPA: HU family DNA-binding protein, partial [Bacteroidales bacterium]|nr:HU family DNA-binding protein [Bacteroidales bacterium]